MTNSTSWRLPLSWPPRPPWWRRSTTTTAWPPAVPRLRDPASAAAAGRRSWPDRGAARGRRPRPPPGAAPPLRCTPWWRGLRRTPRGGAPPCSPRRATARSRQATRWPRPHAHCGGHRHGRAR
ncbi:hypothetical protein QJS66_08385 [Kocuria rhizophila]|nr:hypothetical protein QJS66_08385 [Kocuria rhizophila]